MARFKFNLDVGKMKRAVKAANILSLGHAAGLLRKVARGLIKRAPRKSSAGSPPHTRRGLLKNAIRYVVAKDKQSAVIGPDYTMAGNVGRAHEFGGWFRRRHYPARPFMGPALQKVKDRLAPLWAGSVR